MVSPPLIKIGLLLIKQIGNPIANGIKYIGKKNHFFRVRILVPIAQGVHVMEMMFKMRAMGLKPTEVSQLSESMAIDTGAEAIKDILVFGVAVWGAVHMSQASSRKEEIKIVANNQRFEQIENILLENKFRIDLQETEIKELTRTVDKLQATVSEHSQTFLDKAVSHVFKTVHS